MSDDNRKLDAITAKIDSLHNKTNEMHAATQRELGALTEATENLGEYIRAVSTNTKDSRAELSKHKEDMNAHGIGASRKSLSALAPWFALVISASSLLFLIFKLAEAK